MAQAQMLLGLEQTYAQKLLQIAKEKTKCKIWTRNKYNDIVNLMTKEQSKEDKTPAYYYLLTKTENLRKNLFNRFSLDDWKLPTVWGWMIKFVLPAEAVAIIVWWAVDLIDGETGDGEKWYEFGRETFVMTILQWGSLMLLVILVNCVVYFYRHKEPALDKRPILDDVDTVMTDTKTPEK